MIRYTFLFLVLLISFSQAQGFVQTNEEQINEPSTKPIHGRVVWVEDPATHAIISWTTTLEGSSHQVYYDTVSHGGDIETYNFQERTAKDGKLTMEDSDLEADVPESFYHHASLSNLEPSTRYYFVMSSDDEVSQEYYFITAPDDDRPFQLLWGGDSRLGQGPPHKQRQHMNRKMAQLLEDKPDILALAHGADYCSRAEWRFLYHWFGDHEQTITSDGRMLPVIPSRGNHDMHIGFEENFWIGDEGTLTDYYYTTQIGSQFALITLNTEISMTGNQRDWLENELKEVSPVNQWVMAQYHRPGFAVAKDFDRTAHARVRQQWVPLFEEYNIDLAGEADGHILKRTLPIRNMKHDPTGVVYIGEGGLGVPQRKPNTDLWFVQEPGFVGNGHHVHLLGISKEGLQIRAIGIDNEILDEHTLKPRKKESLKVLEASTR
ncbi:MAG: metallophosphoesterase family protein [Balneolales bacterium]